MVCWGRKNENGSVPDERYDVQSRGVIRVTKKLHQGMHDTRSDLRELDGRDMDRLNEKLPVFRCLDILISIGIRVHQQSTNRPSRNRPPASSTAASSGTAQPPPRSDLKSC